MPRSLSATAPALLPAGVVLGLVGWWIAEEGGYAPGSWYPGLLLLAGLLLAVVLGLGRDRPRLDRAGFVALAAMAGYVAWSYASVLWAGDQGLALEGSNRALAYGLAFGLFVSLPWRAASARALALAFTLVVAVAGAVTVVRLAAEADPVSMFLDGRLASPLGYQNASAALWTAAALPALALAGWRGLRALPRGLLLGLATMLIELAVLAQSRGWLLTLPVVAAIAVALLPGRLRFAGATALAGAGAVVALPELLDLYEAGGSRSQADASPRIAAEAPEAAVAILLTSLAVAAVGAGLAFVDGRLSPGPRRIRQIRRAGAAACAAALLAGAAAGWTAADGNPLARAGDAWDEFRSGEDQPDPGTSSRFGNLGSARYDFWRVAVDATLDQPVGGLGQDNYAARYVGDRRSTQEPRWAHSLPLRLAAHTGLVGLALFALALGAALVPVVRARMRGDGREAATAAVLALPLIVWVVFGSVDWMWEFPALSVASLGLLGAATAVVRDPRIESRIPRGAAPAAAAAACVTALLAGGPPWLAERHVERATESWAQEPGAAFERLDHAAALAPLSSRPHRVEAIIALELGRDRAAAAALRRVLERTPDDWFARFELALVASGAGQDQIAEQELERARRLNPREPLIRAAQRRLGGGRPLTLEEAHEELRDRARRRLGQATG